MPVEQNPFDNEPHVANSNMREDIEGNSNIEVDPSDGSIVVDLNPNDPLTNEESNNELDEDFHQNLVELMDSDELLIIGAQVYDGYNADKESRGEWEQMFERGLDLLGLKLEETSEPFEGAATAVHPLLIESAVKFQSKASAELLPASGPVRTQILGEQTEDKQEQANRIKNFMNYQVTTKMPEFYEESERMLFHLPIMGSAIKKTYYDAGMARPVSEFVPLDQFYVSNFASTLENADRYTQVIYRSPVDMERDFINEMYAQPEDMPDPTLPNSSGMGAKMNQIMGLDPSAEFDPQFTLLEQHVYLDIETDGHRGELKTLPYIVTVEEETREVLAIRRNYDLDDPQRKKKQYFTHYKFVPGFGFYGLGLLHFLGNLTMSATAAMRSLLDAGQFATLPAGFKSKGVRVVGDNDPIAPGEFREVESTGMDLTKSIVPLPYKEPSATLFSMLQFVASTGQKFADSTESIINDSANYGPVGTTMALLEAGGKFFSAIHARLHRAQKGELQILARINYESLDETYPYDLPGGQVNMRRKDFNGKIDIIPVSDPNIPSNAHRMMMSQMAIDLSGKAPPGMYNIEELHRTVLHSANMPNLELILPDKPVAQALDPVSDIVAATKGVPIKAFAGQDHQSHITVKMSYLQDPINGANPIMQRLQPILSANIQEHSVLQWQTQMKGASEAIMAEQGNSSPEVAQQAQAMAAQQVAQANKQSQQQTPEQQMVMLEGKRLELEGRKVDAQLAKENADTVLADRKMDLEENKLKLKAYSDGATALMKDDQASADRDQKATTDALKIITDLIKHEDDLTAGESDIARGLLTKLNSQRSTPNG